jgi:hypothetical protein
VNAAEQRFGLLNVQKWFKSDSVNKIRVALLSNGDPRNSAQQTQASQ